MDNVEQIVPPPNSYWAVKLVETQKPFPNHILANVTFKVLRFLYPPSAVDVVEVGFVVSDPELNVFNVGLFISFSLVLSYVVCAGCKLFRKAKTPDRKSTNPLLEQQARVESEDEFAGNCDQSMETINVLMEPKWLTESNDSLASFGKEDKQDDLAEQIDRAVWESPVAKKQQKH